MSTSALDVERRPPGADGRAAPILTVCSLSVAYAQGRRSTQTVSDVSFQVAPGRTLAILGESGSGKSTIVNSIVRTLPRNGRIVAGSIEFDGVDLGGLRERAFRRLRGSRLGFVPQNPARSLDPLMRAGDQVAEVLRVHRRELRPRERRERTLGILADVGFPRPAEVARRYPHQLSGGMQQRVLIAIAVACGPALLLADEPTSALDVTVQRNILDLLQTMRADEDMGIVLVTHDIGVAADRSDEVLVLRDGVVVEHGPTADVLRRPRAAYTRQLLEDVPSAVAETDRTRPSGAEGVASAAIDVADLAVDYALAGGDAFRAVDGLSLTVARGRTLAIVGESGSGKTTTARAIGRFVRPAAGSVRVLGPDGQDLYPVPDREFRRHVQFVYQSPYSSLNPRHRIRSILTEPLRSFGIGDRSSRESEVRRLLELVALPASVLRRRPRELSGGQQQRVAIARALAGRPEILILDEPVSALDVTVQAQILTLLTTLQRDLGLTYLLISHDLGVVRQISDEVVIMRAGTVVESGPVSAIFTAPAHDYTTWLLDAVPGASLPAREDLATPHANDGER